MACTNSIRVYTKYHFHGDDNLNQLSFQENELIEFNPRKPPQNGWLLGITCSNGKKGWFPVWAVDYVSQEQEQQENRNLPPDEIPLDAEKSGFDLDNNTIMGGRIPTDNSNSTNEENEDDNPFEKQYSGMTQESSSTKSGRFFGRFLNKSKVQPLFQPKTQTPEWNEEPQIIYEGRVIQEFKQKKKGLFQR